MKKVIYLTNQQLRDRDRCVGVPTKMLGLLSRAKGLDLLSADEQVEYAVASGPASKPINHPDQRFAAVDTMRTNSSGDLYLNWSVPTQFNYPVPGYPPARAA